MAADQMPWWYQPSVDLMLQNPGLSFAAATEQVKGRLTALYQTGQQPTVSLVGQDLGMVTYEGDPESDPFGKPWFYEQSVSLMMSNPGMQYDQAVEQIKSRANGRGNR